MKTQISLLKTVLVLLLNVNIKKYNKEVNKLLYSNSYLALQKNHNKFINI